MADPKYMTPEQIAQLSREFETLQEEISALSFPDDLLGSIDRFQQMMAESSAKLVVNTQKIKDNAAEMERMTEIMSRQSTLNDAYNEALERREALTTESTLLQGQLDQSIQAFEQTLLDQNDTLEKSANAQIKYAEAMRLLESGDIEGAKKKLKEAAEAVQDYESSVKGGEAAMKGFLNTTLGVSGGLNKLGGFLKRGVGGLEGMGEALLESAESGELFLNIGLKLIETSINMMKYQIDFALKQDKAIADFRKATGAGTEYNNTIRDTERALFAMGVELEEVTGALMSMRNTFKDLAYMTEAEGDRLAETTTLLGEMGFSFDTQAQIMQVATQSMNMSFRESEQFLLDITAAAKGLGEDIDKVAGEFVANKEFFVGFGKDGAKVFEEMAVQAKSLGMELGTLTNVVDQFTTFDQAGKHVGRLNAILGGPFLNSIDMLNAAMEDPAEAVNMLRDSFDQAGVSLEDMGRADKLAFADALGMSVEDMTNMMGKSREEIELNKIEQEELAEMARQTMDITQQLTKAFQGFYIQMGPVIEETIVPMISHLAALASAMGKFMSTKAGMVAFFLVFGGLLVAGIALVTAFALANMAAATASIVGAPFAAAAGILLASAGVALAGGLGLAAGGMGMMALGTAANYESPSAGAGKKPEARFASGGVVTGTTTAMVGEQGPEMVEMPIGSRVTNAPTTLALTNAINKLTKKLDRMNTDRGNIAVYVGDKEVTDIVVKAMNSSKAKQAISPYGQ